MRALQRSSLAAVVCLALVGCTRGGASSAGSSSSCDARPASMICPSDGTVCKIMAMGDSITFGAGSSVGGYRLPLFKLALTDHKNVTFVGRNSDLPTAVTVNGVQFPQGHEGYSGGTIKNGGGRLGIYTKVDGAVQTNMPHIILLMIGTNDMDLDLYPADAPKRLGQLLDRIINAAPDAMIVVAKVIPFANDTVNGRIRTYNDGIASVIQARISAGRNLKVVDMYEAFASNATSDLMFDDRHPNDAGYSIMAQTWYDAIKPYLH